jgi:hypothetical protein
LTEAEEGLEFKVSDLTWQIAQAKVWGLPALHFGCSSSPGKQPKIRRARPNSNPCEINNLPAEGRAVAGDANRHF